MKQNIAPRPYSPGTWYEGDRPCVANYPQFLLRVSRHLETPKLRFNFRPRK